jgi:hypothetical protein
MDPGLVPDARQFHDGAEFWCGIIYLRVINALGS